MKLNKYFTLLAILILALLGQQAVEAHFLGKVEHELHHAAKKVDKVVSHIHRAKKFIEVGGDIAGAAGAIAAA